MTELQFREAIEAAFKAGRDQGNDEAVSFDWGSSPSQTWREALADLFKDWNTGPVLTALRLVAPPEDER